MSDDMDARCPNCGSCAVVPLMGVLPGAAPYDTVDVGRVPAGQCVSSDTEAQWACEECGHRWGGGEDRRREARKEKVGRYLRE